MSAGSKITPVRIAENKLIEIAVAIRRRNQYSQEAPWNLSEFIRAAIDDKLKHLKRASKQTAKQKADRKARKEKVPA